MDYPMIKTNDKGCWVMQRKSGSGGYVPITVNYKSISAHRLFFTLFHGYIKHNLVIDHICRNRKCVNPAHLRQVTQNENIFENSESIPAKNRLKTHCQLGHEYNDKNTYICKRGKRTCRVCQKLKMRIRRIKND